MVFLLCGAAPLRSALTTGVNICSSLMQHVWCHAGEIAASLVCPHHVTSSDQLTHQLLAAFSYCLLGLQQSILSVVDYSGDESSHRTSNIQRTL